MHRKSKSECLAEYLELSQTKMLAEDFDDLIEFLLMWHRRLTLKGFIKNNPMDYATWRFVRARLTDDWLEVHANGI